MVEARYDRSAMDRSRAVRISKRMSLALRHRPEALGITLDPNGWTTIEALVRGLEAHGERVTADDIDEIVETSDKQRFALSEDGTRIRANQGHSVSVDLGLPARVPPHLLFHGTVDRSLAPIRAQGLVRGSRTHVHLSADVATARIVAARRAGERVLLRVRAAAMHEAGFTFYLSDNGVWLTENVPPAFIEVP